MTNLRTPLVIALALLAVTSPAVWAQSTRASRDVAARHKSVRAALERLRSDNEWTLSQQISICEIPAPPFKEATRAAEFRRRLEALGLRNVRIDAEGNVIAERPGTGKGPTVMIAGHLDTVFPEGTDVRVTREGTKLRGPGIGDDCRGLAVVLAVARALNEANVRTVGTILFVGNVGEEGAGNLRGVRHLFERELKGKVDYFVSVDGIGTEITSRGVGSNRYRISYRGPGGHSYGAFGMPNPAHALGRAIAKIADLQVPATPKATFSVGMLGGGTSVNSIPFEVSMDLDLRSESPQALATLDSAVQRALHAARDEERARWPRSDKALELHVDTIGIRPAGVTPDSSRIVRVALAAGQTLGLTTPLAASSTDSNLPMSLGIPAITMDGGGSGGGAHSLEEWYDDGADGYRGAQWAALVVTGLAGVR